MKKRELRERISDLERAYGDLVHADAQADFYRTTLEMTLQSQQRDINRILERLEPTETKTQPAKPRPEKDADVPEKYPGPETCRESNRKPDPRRQPAGDSDKLLCLHLTKMARQLAVARDTLALYADEKYWDGDHCPMLRTGAAAHALGEMGAVEVDGYDSPPGGDLMTVEDFRLAVQHGALMNCDGFGYPVRNGLANPRVEIRPSRADEIPADASHVAWFNK